MQRAGAARDQQHAARILLDEPGCRKPLLADGIGREARYGCQLCGVRPHLEQQRVARIALAHACHEPARDEQRERNVGRCAERGRRQIEQAQQLRGIAHGGLQGRLP